MPAMTIPEGDFHLPKPPGVDQAVEAGYRTTCAEVLRLICDLSGCAAALIAPVNTAQNGFETCSRFGASEAEYDLAICAQTLLEPDDVMVVRDIRSEVRLSHGLPETTASEFRFYAGLLLTDPQGSALGALWVMDREPRGLSEKIIQTLKVLGRSLATMMSLREAVIRADQLRMVDVTTDLPNRLAFLDTLSQTLARHERDRRPFSLLYLDLDGLRAINEALGWEAGNALLREVSYVLRACLRTEDVAARIGDDQFAVVLVGGDGSEAALVGERIRALVKARSEQAGWPITVSVGAASFLTGPYFEVDALHIVDFLMVCAKKAGQDRVVCRSYHARQAAFDG